MVTVATERAASLFPAERSAQPIATGRDFEYGTCDNEFQFLQAQPSGLVFLANRPVAEALPVIYPDHYEPYRFESFPGLLRRARDWVQRGKVRVIRQYAPPGGDILDVGCGSGQLLRLIRAHGRADWKLHANEMHQPSLDRLAEQGFITHAGPIQQVPGDALFDVIVLNQVIEHFADVHGLLAACRRLLRPGGVLLIETPSTSGMDFELFKTRHWGGYHVPRHFYLFNAHSLGQLLAEHGFAVKNTQYLASPAFWTQSLHHRAMESRLARWAAWFHLKNLPLTALVTLIDLVRIALGLKTSNMRVAARREP
jgi:SAM-dependent methyltransferase